MPNASGELTRASEVDGLEVLTLPDVTAWESWLAEHHATREAVWLRIAKKASAVRTVDATEGTEVALCYGWIDSHRRGLDATFFLQKYTPRRPKSAWSKINVDRVDALTAAGRMRGAGMMQVDAAKADGRWARAYESQRDVTLPPDLAAALAATPAAQDAFEALGKTDRYLLILRLAKARSAAARAAQLDKLVGTLAARHGAEPKEGEI
jgi:uncharacterized protein YdeI (YjbR/CyaY-like superfamily)